MQSLHPDKIYLRLAADVTAPCLVLIHGGPGMSWNYFQPLIKAIPDSLSVFACDQGVTKPLSKFSEIADELHDLVKGTIPESAPLYLIGHSFGGLVALDYFERFNRSAILILISWVFDDEWRKVFLERTPDYEAIQVRLEEMNLSATDEETKFLNIMRAYSRLYFVESAQERAELLLRQLRYYPELLEKLSSDSRDGFSGPEILKAICRPTLSIVGDRDRVVYPDYTERAADLNSLIETVRIQEAGHFPFFERPEVVGRTIVNFVVDIELKKSNQLS